MENAAPHPSRMDRGKRATFSPCCLELKCPQDFDGGAVGQAVSSALNGINPGINGVSWKVVSPSQFPEGISQLQNAIVQEKTWYAVAS